VDFGFHEKREFSDRVKLHVSKEIHSLETLWASVTAYRDLQDTTGSVKMILVWIRVEVAAQPNS
jgi:hypothetical protein